MVFRLVFLAIMLAAFCSFGAAQDCPTPEELFVMTPSGQIADVGDNATFNCSVRSDYGIILFAWEYFIINSTAFQTLSQNSPSLRLSFINDGNVSWLKLTSAEARHAGRYRCRAEFLNRNDCPRIYSDDAIFKVTGPPVISLSNNSFAIETSQILSISGTISGHPSPRVKILQEVEGTFVESVDERITHSFDIPSSRLTITINGTIRRDMGTYKIQASNKYGLDEDEFTVMVTGPDLPVVTITPLEVVSRLEHIVTVMCSIQQEAFEHSNSSKITWLDTNDEAVPLAEADSALVTSTDFENGSVLLTIQSLQTNLLGAYKCHVMNERGSDQGTVQVWGPPPPPATPITVKESNRFVISWEHPSSPVTITQYSIELINKDTGILIDQQLVNASEGRYVINEDIEPGTYQVRVFSLSNDVKGTYAMAEFVVDPEETSFPLTIVIVVAAVVAVVIVGFVIGIAVCCYCYCSYNARKNKNTHQQRWGSEEDKMNQQQQFNNSQAVQNSYTALALDNNAELPPSPLSPMTSAIGIDPKWEFPRENIQLSEVLAEGQFTVLYKGIARNLREKPCEIAVKALKDDATEDDLKALIYEMDVLSGIEEHPNIVSLVRVCSVGKPLYMVMEYMCHGDLLGFLRGCRGHHGMYTISPGNRYQPPSLQLCSRDLLNMATKIANGMRYLADRKIVHRALCTRNILVGSGMDVKIYNVGSFDANLDNRDGGIVKWMAPETLYDGTNTTYSDVWSFGVTLWELVTVGGTPYGEILPEDLYSQLQSGMRMPCPSHCAQEVYGIMSACWQKNPTDRPHFAIIHEELDELVMSKLNYLDLRSYDGYAYSQFGDEAPQLSTAL